MGILEPVFPEPGPAREWLHRELAKSEYQPDLLQLVRDWVIEQLQRLSGFGGPGVGLVYAWIGFAILAIGVCLLLLRVRRDPRSGRERPGAVFAERQLSSNAHRALARAALAAGKYDEAVVEAMRALTAGLIERELISSSPGITAHEVTNQASARFPSYAARLATASRVFDETRYGDRPANESAARGLLALEDDLAHADPEATAMAGPYLAVPR